MNERVLVTGAGAQLAAAIIDEFAPDSEVLPLTHAQLDICDHRAVHDAVAQCNPAVIINCASYNHVDAAEDDSVAALQVNAFGVRVLARVAAERDAVLVHYSTDFVFDGRGVRPYTEDDVP